MSQTVIFYLAKQSSKRSNPFPEKMLLKPINQQPGVQLLTAHFLGLIEASQITHYISRQFMIIEMFYPKLINGKVSS